MIKLNTSQIIAIIASILIACWFILNTVISPPDQTNNSEKIATLRADIPTPTVVTLYAPQEERFTRLKLFGQTKANRMVSVKAQTAGRVIETPLREGQFVKKGALLCRQGVDARDARVEQSQALLTQAEQEYIAAQKLFERGFRSDTQVAQLKAAHDAAIAGLKAAKIERGNIDMHAPFKGVFERQDAQIGDYLAPGQPCGLIVELDPLLISVELTERQLAHTKKGEPVDVTLATGETVTGKISRISAIANPATRSFTADITVPNPELSLKAGVTADVIIKGLSAEKAHLIPATLLAVDINGTQGVAYLDRENRIQFSPVTIIDESEDGLWVRGLPNNVQIVKKGHNFVEPGTIVSPTLDR